MRFRMLKTNKLYNIDCRKGLALLDDESIDCCISSPPYYNLRDYEIEPSIWDGNFYCDHEFEIEQYKNPYDRTDKGKHEYIKNTDISNKSGFCKKCGAWSGALGLEPTIDLFIKHLCDIYDLIKQKLKKMGTCWVNLGDTYSQGGRSGSKKYFEKGHKQFGKADPKGKYQAPLKVEGFPPKTLLMIPERFAIEMINRGWILRNVVIWKKNNSTPESARDRFTRNYEYLYFFVKSSKTQYYINEKTGLCVDKPPKERIENMDWEWRICNKCNGTGIIQNVKKTKLTDMNKWSNSPRAKYQNERGSCKKCKGSGQIKHNFWTGRDYWFDQNSVKEAISQNESTQNRYKYKVGDQENRKDEGIIMVKPGKPFNKYFPTSRNKRCIWAINTKPNPEAHFATFPPELVKIPIKSGCPEFICRTCGKPREKLSDKWADCGCKDGWNTGLVLDPFAGTGTTLLQAFKLGRDFIGFEISKEYCKIASKYLSKETNFKRITEFTSKIKMEED